MRHRKKGRGLSRTVSHKKATMRNMVTSLFRHERIETTTAKAKELRPFAERLITLGKRGDLHARRLAGRWIADRQVLGKLFDDIGPRFTERARRLHAHSQAGKSARRRRGDGADRVGRLDWRESSTDSRLGVGLDMVSFGSRRGEAGSLSIYLMVGAFLVAGGFFAWLSVKAAPVDVAVVEEGPVENLATVVAIDVFGTNPLGPGGHAHPT